MCTVEPVSVLAGHLSQGSQNGILCTVLAGHLSITATFCGPEGDLYIQVPLYFIFKWGLHDMSNLPGKSLHLADPLSRPHFGLWWQIKSQPIKTAWTPSRVSNLIQFFYSRWPSFKWKRGFIKAGQWISLYHKLASSPCSPKREPASKMTDVYLVLRGGQLGQWPMWTCPKVILLKSP